MTPGNDSPSPSTQSAVAATPSRAGAATRVAFLGPRGTFTEQAMEEMIRQGYLPADTEGIPVGSPRAALDEVRAGNADFAIAIRTALMRNGTAYVQAGGGIVADSDPESELAERTGLANATVSNIVRDLREHGVDLIDVSTGGNVPARVPVGRNARRRGRPSRRSRPTGNWSESGSCCVPCCRLRANHARAQRHW